MSWLHEGAALNVVGVFVSAVAGLLTGLSLIIAIGAQNVFVLRQGLRREHVGVTVAVCALSDLMLIMVGVSGVGAVVERFPVVLTVARWFGAAFLLAYAALAVRRVVRGDQHLEVSTGAGPRAATGVALTAVALTWLNPHVYLDTLLLLGSIASSHGDLRWWFAAGAGLASLAWFTALGWGARALTPLFRRPIAWRVLDGLVAVVMVGIAAALVLSG